MNLHHEIRLPKFLLAFLSITTGFATSHVTTKAGYDVIKLDNNLARRIYQLVNCRINLNQFEDLQTFFKGRCGKLYSFRLTDLTDYKAENQLLGYGNNSLKEFKLIKTYHDAVNPYNRQLKLPNLDSLEVKVNDEIRADYIFDSNQAAIVFNQAIAQDAAVTASFTFDVMARFNVSELQYKFSPDGTVTLNDIEIKEVVGAFLMKK